ncbi:MAG: rhodanese-like domain-containing protein [Verrucomicrobiales bacterium]|jgi:rhodanese-related sulfurtransferase|nr:rhodanese-like domain-containing protein [Verrucomicrobiales bacterium]
MMKFCHFFKRDKVELIIIVVISVGLGWTVGFVHKKPLSLVYQSKVGEVKQASLTLEQFRDFVDGKKGIVLDVRPGIFYRLGHVPGAISLPRDDFEKGYQKLQALLEKDKRQPIAIYCSGESCEDSGLLHGALARLGYVNIQVFQGGWDEWTRAGLPEELVK